MTPGFAHEGGPVSEGGYFAAVLRDCTGTEVWRCPHEHDTMRAAITCAWHERGMRRQRGEDVGNDTPWWETEAVKARLAKKGLKA